MTTEAKIGMLLRSPTGAIARVTGVATGRRVYLSYLTDDAVYQDAWVDRAALQDWVEQDPADWEDE